MNVLAVVLCLVAGPPQLPLSWAVTDDVFAVFANPAGLARARGANAALLYNFASDGLFDNAGIAASAGPLGGYWSSDRWGLGLGGGSASAMAGLRLERDSVCRWTLGTMARPASWVSVGVVWRDLGHDWGSLGGALAVRPLGRRLTLSADVTTGRLGADGFVLADPVAGIDFEPLDGLTLSGRVKPADWSFSAGLRVGLGRAGVGGVASRVGSATQAGGYVTLGTERRRSILPRPRRWVSVRLSGPLTEGGTGFSLLGPRGGREFADLLGTLRRARMDPSVRGLVVRIDGLSAGVAQLSELRRSFEALREAGKEIVVYAPSYGMGSYYLASAADRVICHTMGDVAVPGVYAEPMFLKGTLEKLGLAVDVVRLGEYKSAPEMFTEDSLSPDNREQLEAYLDAVYDGFLADVSRSRGIVRESLAGLVDRGYFLAHEARVAGLVDTFCYADELDSLLKSGRPGFRAKGESDMAPERDDEGAWSEPPVIAVINAVGGIGGGKSGTDFLTGERSMGSATMVKAIREARDDRRVKAIVLRVDSPGGDGFASDVIWHELERAKARKPLAVSMGNVAASGGYYISAGAERVFANPATLTGSIGAFSLKFITEGLYSKLGARRQVLKRGERADMGSDARAYTPGEDSLLQAQIQWFYDQFVAKAAQGRGMSAGAVDSVGRGRIWAGRDAARLGLVDSLGGLEDAVEWARGRAKLRDARVETWPKPERGFGIPMDRLAEKVLGGLLWR